jgi:hypothetical protein
MSHLFFDTTLLDEEDWDYSIQKLERYIKTQNIALQKARVSAAALSASVSTSTTKPHGVTMLRSSLGIIPNHQFTVWMDGVYSSSDNEVNINIIQQKFAKQLAMYHYDPIQVVNYTRSLLHDLNITLEQAIVAIVRHAMGTPVGTKSTL